MGKKKRTNKKNETIKSVLVIEKNTGEYDLKYAENLDMSTVKTALTLIAIKSNECKNEDIDEYVESCVSSLRKYRRLMIGAKCPDGLQMFLFSYNKKELEEFTIDYYREKAAVAIFKQYGVL